MRIKQLILSVILLVIGGLTAVGQQMSLPMDPDVRTGKLANGLTYYIRHNNWPENRANFYIAQRVGSIQEEESQRGLAHFLEHMAFNGSDHFKGNALLRYCESIGVQFGGDLNAFTSIDRTVYNIDNVPTTNPNNIDSCLLILRDWSCGLLLEQDEIDKERGVIHEEWRMRTDAGSRMFERNLPTLYPGSKYGLRYPIGLMSVVDNFKRKELVDYYHKWYHPSNQGIIVVGNVDVDKVEAEIKKLFGDIKNPANAAPVVDEQVPDNAEPIVVVDKDKEFQQSIVELMIKQDVFPDSLKNSPYYYVNEYMNNAVCKMLSDRINERALKADCPFVGGDASYGNYIFAKTKDALTMAALPKDPTQTSASLKALIEELRRASLFGFTATEYKRFQQDYLSSLDKAYSNKDKRTNTQLYNQILGNYLDHDPLPSIDVSYQLMKQMVPMIPVEAINEAVKESFHDNDSNLVIINFNTEKEGATYPTKQQLLDAVKAARGEQLTAYVDNVKNEPLIKQEPKGGKIVKQETNDKFGYTTLTLQNGVKVIYKKTDFKKDQVMMVAEGGAGSSVYDFKKEGANLKLFDDAIESSGLGGFSNKQLEKALAGVIAGTSLQMNSRHMSISGNSTPKDLRTLMQLTYLTFTDITKDQDEWDNLIKQNQVELAERKINPDVAFSDSITNTLYNHNERVAPLNDQDLKTASYDRILAMAKERLANARGWEFTFIGNFDVDSLKQFAVTYLGSLPAGKKAETGKRMADIQPGVRVCDFNRKMETPKATALIVWTSHKIPYTTEHDIQASIAGQILTMEYLQSIREDSSAAYSVQAFGGMNIDYDNYNLAIIQAFCPMKPEKQAVARKILYDEVSDLAKTCDADKLDKVKKLMLKRADDNAKQNGYWLGIINNFRHFGVDDYTNYKKLVEAQTPQSISKFMQELLQSGDHCEVVMLPAK